MDHERFDALTRMVAAASRRSLLRRALAAGMVVTLGGTVGRWSAAAHHCTDAGCGCATGTRHACGHGLVCCPINPGMPGGAGVCAWRGECASSPEPDPEPCGDLGCECDYHDPYSCNTGLNCCAEGWSFVCC